jgi:hypothetical protein
MSWGVFQQAQEHHGCGAISSRHEIGHGNGDWLWHLDEVRILGMDFREILIPV